MTSASAPVASGSTSSSSAGPIRCEAWPRGYFTGEGLEGCNVPDELTGRGVGCDQSDHNDQITEIGADIGGPLIRNRAWFWGSYVNQDIRLVRSAGNLIDRTVLKTTNIKGNWQATSKDMFSVLWFLGAKEKANRATGVQQVEPTSARWFQGNAYPDGAPHGLLKVQDDRVMSSSNFLSVKYAYYGTGFSLTPQGGMELESGQSSRLGQTFGSTYLQEFLRPQWVVNADGNHFANVLGGHHDFKYGFAWRRTESFARVLYPGNMVEARDNSATDTRARLWRERAGTDRTEQWSVYVGDTMTMARATVDVGVRFDRQGGRSLASETRANAAFPSLVPGIELRRLRSAVHVEQRVASRRSDLRPRRREPNGRPSQLLALRRPDLDRLRGLRECRLYRRVGRVSLARWQRRLPLTSPRSRHVTRAGVWRRIRSRGAHRRHVGQPIRCGFQGPDYDEPDRRDRSGARREFRGIGELLVLANLELERDALGRPHRRRLPCR